MERLDHRIVLHRGVIVELAGKGDLLLQLRQLPLQINKVVVGLQLGIGFGHGEQRAQGVGQIVFRLLALFDRLRRLHHRPGLRDFLQHFLFMRRITFDGFHQVRHQIKPPLQLDIDLRPAVLDHVAQPHHRVVAAGQPEADGKDDSAQDQKSGHSCHHRFIAPISIVFLLAGRQRPNVPEGSGYIHYVM